MIFDGRIDSGIKLLLANFWAEDYGVFYPGAVQFAAPTSGVNHVTITYCDLAGPAPDATAYPHKAVNCPLSVKSYDGSYQPVTDITISHCKMHGGADIALLAGAQRFVFEYDDLYDNNSSSPPDDGGCPTPVPSCTPFTVSGNHCCNDAFHPNLFEYLESGDVTVRYCDIHDWASEGFMLYQDSHSRGPFYCYGNLFHKPIPNCLNPPTCAPGTYGNCCARVVEVFGYSTDSCTIPTCDNNGQGPVYFYNNTVVDIISSVFSTTTNCAGCDGKFAAGSISENNIFWKCYGQDGYLYDLFPVQDHVLLLLPHNYDYADRADITDTTTLQGETHGINGTGATPFVDYAARDFHIVSTVNSTYPRDKGLALDSSYNMDKDGNIRGGIDGTWDTGAYEYTISIYGKVSYCTDVSSPGVPTVTLALTGDGSASTTTDGFGSYTFSSLSSGLNYTVTPSKTARAPGSNGINTVDVAAVQRHFLGIASLSGCALAAADVNGDTFVNNVDVIAISRFYQSYTTGIANVGKYQFTPSNRTYTGMSQE